MHQYACSRSSNTFICKVQLYACGNEHQLHPTLPVLHRTNTQRRQLACSASNATDAHSAKPAQPATPAAAAGLKVIPALLAIAVGLLVKFVVPAPAGVTAKAWSLFAIFLSTITGLVLEPLPVGAWAFCGLTAVVATKTLPFSVAMSAMTNEVIWLIVISFFFAKGFEKTGLGERIANLFVMALGKSTLGLAYGLAIAGTHMLTRHTE